MVFSKTFGYAVRGVMYIAMVQDEKQFVHVEEISERLEVPRHFLGKILKKLVKENILHSVKGPLGGFTLSEGTLDVPLMRFVNLSGGNTIFKTCVLRWKECNAESPCPMHADMDRIKGNLRQVLETTTISDLLKNDKAYLINSISTGPEFIFQTIKNEPPAIPG